MSAITSDNVTVVRKWMTRDASGGEREVVADLIIALWAQGGTAGDIPASALGLSYITVATPQQLDVSGTPKLATVGVATDGSELIPADVDQATDANRTGRANITGNLYIRVHGRPAL